MDGVGSGAGSEVGAGSAAGHGYYAAHGDEGEEGLEGAAAFGEEEDEESGQERGGQILRLWGLGKRSGRRGPGSRRGWERGW